MPCRCALKAKPGRNHSAKVGPTAPACRVEFAPGHACRRARPGSLNPRDRRSGCPGRDGRRGACDSEGNPQRRSTLAVEARAARGAAQSRPCRIGSGRPEDCRGAGLDPCGVLDRFFSPCGAGAKGTNRPRGGRWKAMVRVRISGRPPKRRSSAVACRAWRFARGLKNSRAGAQPSEVARDPGRPHPVFQNRAATRGGASGRGQARSRYTPLGSSEKVAPRFAGFGALQPAGVAGVVRAGVVGCPGKALRARGGCGFMLREIPARAGLSVGATDGPAGCEFGMPWRKPADSE